MNAAGFIHDHALAVFAHELRAPLASILFAAQALDTSGDDEQVNRDLCAIVERQSRYAAALIEDVLEVCRANAGKTRLRQDRCDLRLVVARAVETVGPLMSQRHHRLSLDLAEKAIPVVADALRLQQIIVNLLANAAKYTPPGGQIRLAVEADDSFVRIEVRDNGAGIAPALLPHVFDFYRQGQSSAGRTSAGLGIGLALVKTLVELHGGSVRARSDGIGTGSTFVVRLPVAGRSGRRTPAFTSPGPARWRARHHPAVEAMGDA